MTYDPVRAELRRLQEEGYKKTWSYYKMIECLWVLCERAGYGVPICIVRPDGQAEFTYTELPPEVEEHKQYLLDKIHAIECEYLERGKRLTERA